MIEEISDWMYGQRDVLSYGVIARKIKEISKLPEVTQAKVGDTMSRCRVVMELRYKTTIVNVRGVGYKLADPDELAMTTAKWVKRTIMYADRTYRLVDITDRRKIPGALKQVFTDSEGRIKTLSVRGRKFVESFTKYQKTLLLEESKNANNTVKRTEGNG